jgi:hypothetical protein
MHKRVKNQGYSHATHFEIELHWTSDLVENVAQLFLNRFSLSLEHSILQIAWDKKAIAKSQSCDIFQRMEVYFLSEMKPTEGWLHERFLVSTMKT